MMSLVLFEYKMPFANFHKLSCLSQLLPNNAYDNSGEMVDLNRRIFNSVIKINYNIHNTVWHNNESSVSLFFNTQLDAVAFKLEYE